MAQLRDTCMEKPEAGVKAKGSKASLMELPARLLASFQSCRKEPYSLTGSLANHLMAAHWIQYGPQPVAGHDREGVVGAYVPPVGMKLPSRRSSAWKLLQS